MKKYILLIFTGLLAWACSEDNVITPPPEFRFDASHGQYVVDTLYSVDDVFLITDPIETGTSTTLSVGRNSDYEAFVLIKFSELPDDTLKIDSVYFELKGLGKLSQGEPTDMNLELYEVPQLWDVEANTDDVWRNFEPSTQPYATQTISLEDSLTYRFLLDTALLSKWQNEDENLGLLIRAAPDVNQIIKEFGSFNSIPVQPHLMYSIRTDTSVIKDTLDLGADATIFRYTGSVYENAAANNDLVISSGFTSRAYIKFDYSGVPQNVLLASANLILYENTDNHLKNPYHTNGFFLRSIIETGNGLSSDDSSYTYDGNVYYILSEGEGELKMDFDNAVSFGQGYIQALINRNLRHEWFSIQYIGEATSLSLIKLFGEEAAKEKRPRLILRYFITE